MADNRSRESRSWNMSRIPSKDTKIEVQVRKYLFHKGFRYRKNVRKLPGCPDIVLPKYRSVIFVNGCYWHRHPFCKIATMPKTNTEFWQQKFDRNVARDRKHYAELESAGWNVIVIWGCEVQKNFEINMQRVVRELEENYIEIATLRGSQRR